MGKYMIQGDPQNNSCPVSPLDTFCTISNYFFEVTYKRNFKCIFVELNSTPDSASQALNDWTLMSLKLCFCSWQMK